MIGSIAFGIGSYTTRCRIERNYELLPKNVIEQKIEQETEYIQSQDGDYAFQLKYNYDGK